MGRMNGLTKDLWADAVHVPLTRDEWVRRIHVALEVTGGRRLRAARLLGISERTLRRYIGAKPGSWPLRGGGRIEIPEPTP